MCGDLAYKATIGSIRRPKTIVVPHSSIQYQLKMMKVLAIQEHQLR